MEFRRPPIFLASYLLDMVCKKVLLNLFKYMSIQTVMKGKNKKDIKRADETAWEKNRERGYLQEHQQLAGN